MEKYRQFADGGTGINPFVPLWSHHRTPWYFRPVQLLVLFPIACLRIVVLLIAVGWLAAAGALCSLIPIGVIRYPLHSLLATVGCRVALLALGVYLAGDVCADHRRLKIPAPKIDGGNLWSAPRGTVVFANQQGFVDVLFLCLRLRPMVFVFAAVDGSPVPLGVVGALLAALSCSPPAAPTKNVTLAEISDSVRASWRGPVVVFPEGTNSNGSCVFPWKARTFDSQVPLEKVASGVALASVRYSGTGAYTVHHTVGSASRHVFWIAMQPWHTVSGSWLPLAEAGAAIRGKPAADQWAFLRTLLCRMLPGAVEVEIGAEVHATFRSFWDASQRKGYAKQPAGKLATKSKKRD